MLATLKAWMPLLKLGNTRKMKNELTSYSKYLVLNALKNNAILNAFQKPISLSSLIELFNWEYPSKYVDDFLDVLVRDDILILNNGHYTLTPKADLLLQKPLVHNIEDFNTVFEEYANKIPNRLKGNYSQYTGQVSLFNWDSVLAGQIYSALRDAAFNFININKLRNGKFLDVGCGPGYETSDIWLKLRGQNMSISAIEPDPNLLQIAKDEFEHRVKNYDKTIDRIQNPPAFKLGNAESIDFEDNSFDAVYFSNILHWLPNPFDGVKEMVRVLKPGGILFGSQGTSEVTNPYLDLAARVIKGTNGYFPKKNLVDWFQKAGIKSLKTATLVNVFTGHK